MPDMQGIPGPKPVKARVRDPFICCRTPMSWPTRTEDRVCPDCQTPWEHDGVDLGAGARIKRDWLRAQLRDDDDA